MITPTDLLRLSLRVERLERTDTSGWHPADELDLRNTLSGRGHRKVPSSITLRGMAATMRDLKEEPKGLSKDFQGWNHTVLDLESVAHRNRADSPQRIMRDMARGKFPGFRG